MLVVLVSVVLSLVVLSLVVEVLVVVATVTGIKLPRLLVELGSLLVLLLDSLALGVGLLLGLAEVVEANCAHIALKEAATVGSGLVLRQLRQLIQWWG